MSENEREKGKPENKLIPVTPTVLHDGKDELNFAEFPLGIISKRANPTQKTLVFEDSIHDQKTGELVKRKLTISGTDAFGLPTSTDDEVLLALIQISKLQGFASEQVYFTRYQLVRLLGWPLNGQSYERIKQALNRWHGVGLYYENSWRDRAGGKWKNEDFHILDNVKLDPSENEKTRPKPTPNQDAFEFASSFFKWNDVVFKSFKEGNLKGLDFTFVMGLKSAISRRLYRFLDKRFHSISRTEYDLKTLAFEKIALSRNTPTGDLKRQMGNAIRELEEAGFLKTLPPEERFKKIRAGVWHVVFERGTVVAPAERKPGVQSQPDLPTEAIAKELCAAGIEYSKALKLALKYEAAFIREKLSVLNHLVAKAAPSVSQNPAGFLIKSIEKGYKSPKRFTVSPVKAATFGHKPHKEQTLHDAKHAEQETAIRHFWEKLSNNARREAELEALTNPAPVERALAKQGANGAQLARSATLYRYAKKKLQDLGKWPA